MGISYLEQIGAQVQYLRESRRWDRLELARFCGVHVTTIYGIESGTYKAPYSLYEDICITLGFTARDLFGGFHWTYTPPALEKDGAIIEKIGIA